MAPASGSAAEHASQVRVRSCERLANPWRWGLACATLVLSLTCSQNYEAGTHPELKPRQTPTPAKAAPVVAAPSSAQAGSSPAVISGTIRLSPALKGRVPNRAYLYIMAREEADGGMPFALKRIPVPRFPYAYSLSQSDVMGMGEEGADLARAEGMYLVARIDQDGMAGVQPGDLEGACADNPVSGGGQDLDIVIEPVH